MPIMDTSAHDDILIAAALARFSYDYSDTDPELADRAWHLAEEYAGDHGLSPADAVQQITPNSDT